MPTGITNTTQSHIAKYCAKIKKSSGATAIYYKRQHKKTGHYTFILPAKNKLFCWFAQSLVYTLGVTSLIEGLTVRLIWRANLYRSGLLYMLFSKHTGFSIHLALSLFNLV